MALPTLHGPLFCSHPESKSKPKAKRISFVVFSRYSIPFLSPFSSTYLAFQSHSLSTPDEQLSTPIEYRQWAPVLPRILIAAPMAARIEKTTPAANSISLSRWTTSSKGNSYPMSTAPYPSLARGTPLKPYDVFNNSFNSSPFHLSARGFCCLLFINRLEL